MMLSTFVIDGESTRKGHSEIILFGPSRICASGMENDRMHRSITSPFLIRVSLNPPQLHTPFHNIRLYECTHLTFKKKQEVKGRALEKGYDVIGMTVTIAASHISDKEFVIS